MQAQTLPTYTSTNSTSFKLPLDSQPLQTVAPPMNEEYYFIINTLKTVSIPQMSDATLKRILDFYKVELADRFLSRRKQVGEIKRRLEKNGSLHVENNNHINKNCNDDNKTEQYDSEVNDLDYETTQVYFKKSRQKKRNFTIVDSPPNEGDINLEENNIDSEENNIQKQLKFWVEEVLNGKHELIPVVLLLIENDFTQYVISETNTSFNHDLLKSINIDSAFIRQQMIDAVTEFRYKLKKARKPII